MGPKRKGEERATWGEPSVVREEGAPALSSRGEVLLFGLLPPSPAPVKALSQAWFPLCSLDLLGDWLPLPPAGRVTIAHRLHCC